MTSLESIPGFVQNEILSSMENLSKQKAKRFWDHLTLEPVLGSSIMAIMMAITAFQNAHLQRACMVDLGLDEELCLRGVGPEKKLAEMSSQKVIAELSVLRGVISNSIQAIVMMFFGPWSDRSRRRKPLVLVAIGGMVVAYVNMVILLNIPSLPVIWMMYLEMIPMALSGGFHLMFMAAFSYLGDICYKTGRDATSLMGMNSAVIQACSTLGALLGPFMYRKGGLLSVFSISLGLQTFSFIYAWKMMEDINQAVKNVPIFDISLPVKALQCLFRKREGDKRKILMVMVVGSLLHSFLMSAEMVNMYMYLRNKYAWTEVAFGVFSAYKSILGCVSTLFIIYVMKNRLKLADETLGIIGTVSHGVVIMALYLSKTTMQVFLTPILGALSSASSLVHKPILNKQINGDEQGKINAVISVMDTMVSIFAGPASSALYARTVISMPGLFLLPCIVTSFLQALCFVAISNFRFTLPAVVFSSMYMYYMSQYQ